MKIEVLVIGAGMAGLTAAHKLAGRGFDVAVLERENYVGGRVRSDSLQGLALEAGAQFVGGMYRNTLALLKEMALDRMLNPIKMRVDVIGRGYRYPLCRHTLLGPCPSLSTLPWKKKPALLKLGLFLRSHRSKIHISDLPAGLDLDDISFGDWAANLLSPQVVNQYLDPAVTALFFQPAGRISRLIPLTLLRDPHKCQVYNLINGLTTLPEALAKTVPVFKNTQALKVQCSVGEKHVKVGILLPGGKKETLLANRVVFAIPPAEALAVLHDPAETIGPKCLKFLTNIQSVGVKVTCLVLSEPVTRRLYGYVFQPGGHGLTSISFGQPIPGHPGNNSVTIVSSGAPATHDNEQPVDEIDLVASAEQHCPGISQKIMGRRDYYWQYAIPCFPPGHIRAGVGFLAEYKNNDRLAFCGDYLGGPGIEGAVTSGLAAANRITFSFS